MDAAEDRSSLVPGTHRLIRAVDNTEGPFAGTLVVYEDGVAVSADAADLTEWGGWAHSDADHICGAMDLRRRIDGHDVLLPWCTQRVETFVGRRRAAGALLSAGELATLVASLMRGMRELGADAAAVIGDWWLTGDGRPLFVHGEGGGARARTAGLIERVCAHTTDRATLRILDEMMAALRERRHHPDDDARWEEQLFATAAPRALRLDVFAPERAAELVDGRMLRGDESRRTRRERREPRAERFAPRIGGRMLDALRSGLRERAQTLMASLPRRAERRGAHNSNEQSVRSAKSRRRALVLAGSVAALVFLIGLMRPEAPEPESASAATISQGVVSGLAAHEGEITSEPTAPPEQDSDEVLPTTEEDVLLAVPALLTSIAECVEAASEACPDALAEGLALPVTGAVMQGARASEATLVDDYGDVAVVKLAPVDAADDAASQMLVLERRNDKWLVRDIYDVAHQPG